MFCLDKILSKKLDFITQAVNIKFIERKISIDKKSKKN